MYHYSSYFIRSCRILRSFNCIFQQQHLLIKRQMGISGLTKVLGDHAPECIKEQEIKNYFGRKVAIDASMSIYQFLIAVRSEGNVLMNEAGETTSHLMGMFYRTIRMVENGIKPLYVFDGRPPALKSTELSKRTERRREADKALDEAREAANAEDMDKFSRRTVKVTPEHNAECKRLLKLLGIPYLDSPSEAESQCAALAKAGVVFATGSEDMDSLTFGTPILLRHLTFSEARKMPILEIHLNVALQQMELTMDQFIDLCILLGCDYCDSIKGIGPHRAVSLIKQHGSLEKVIESLDTEKYPLPDPFPYEEARRLFISPDVVKSDGSLEFKWEMPDEEGVVEFLVKEKGFAEDRVRNAVKKLVKSKGTATQGRLDSFFSMQPTQIKRKVEVNDTKKKGKKAK